MTSWRDIWLKPGCCYLVIESKTGPISTIGKGQILKFLNSGYSAYDSSTMLNFQDAEGNLFSFEIRDDEEDSTRQYFAIINHQ